MEMTIQEAKKRYTLYCRRYSQATQTIYAYNLNQFIDGLPESIKKVSEITPEHVQDYLDAMISKGISNSTYNLYLNAIRSFFKYLCRYYRFDDNPAMLFEDLKTEDTPVRVLTEKELDAIKKLKGKGRDQVIFVAYTGLRASEFCRLELENFSEGYTSLTLIGKGGKKRCIPLNRTCREILEKYEGRINYGARGKQFSRNTFYKMLKNVSNKAKIKEFNPHSLRHYFATALLLRGVQVQYVTKMLGHSTSAITERTYIHIPPAYLKNAIDRLGPTGKGT